MKHREFIKALGGGSEIAAWFGRAVKQPVDREAIYKWSVNGVPWKWRTHLSKMAKERGVEPPQGFLQ